MCCIVIDNGMYAAIAAKAEKMPVVKITHVYDYAGQRCMNTNHFFNPTVLPTADDVSDLMTDFSTRYVPAINGIQVGGVANYSVIGYAYNLGYSQEVGIAGSGGAIAVGDALSVAKNLPLLVKWSLSSTLLNDGGAAYTGNRPVRRGRIFLSGLPEDMMDKTGFTVPAGRLAAYTAFQAVQNDTLLSGVSTLWSHVVFGLELPERPTPPGSSVVYPARPFVVAPITTGVGVRFTKLDTRD